MPALQGVDHPSFRRLSATHYLVTDPERPSFLVTIHVGQIADFLRFDEQIRLGGGPRFVDAIPLGYAMFADRWNAGAGVGDHRRLSKVSFSERDNSYRLTVSTNPPTVSEFFITVDQVGVGYGQGHH
jgi:hypothetical protein